MALERNPDAADAMLDARWEIASHGWRWIDYQFIPEAEEIEHLERAVEIHRQVTGFLAGGFLPWPNQSQYAPNHGRARELRL